MRCLPLIATALVAFSPAALAAQDLLDMVPADSEVVISLDVADLLATPLAQELWAKHIESTEAGAGLRMVTRLTGMDVRTDIAQIVIATQVDAEATEVVLARATFDEQALLDLVMMNETYGKVEADGRTIHRWMDNGKQKHGAFLPGGVVVITNDAARMRQALDAADQKRDSFADSRGASALPDALAWMHIEAPARSGVELGEGMRILQAKSMTTTLELGASSMEIATTLVPTSPSLGEDYAAMLSGIVALGRVQLADPRGARGPEATTVGQPDASGAVTTRTKMDNAAVKSLIDEAIAAGK